MFVKAMAILLGLREVVLNLPLITSIKTALVILPPCPS